MDGRRREDLERQIIAAGLDRRLVLVHDEERGNRIVEPYMLINSKKGHRLLHCFQVAGYSGSGEPTGWRNLDLEWIEEVEPLDVEFHPRGRFREQLERAEREADAEPEAEPRAAS